MTFPKTAGAFDIQAASVGPSLTIQGGGITNNDAGLERFSVPVNFGAAATINAAAAPHENFVADFRDLGPDSTTS